MNLKSYLGLYNYYSFNITNNHYKNHEILNVKST